MKTSLLQVPLIPQQNKSMSLFSCDLSQRHPELFVETYRFEASDAITYPEINMYSCQNITLFSQGWCNVILDDKGFPLEDENINKSYISTAYRKTFQTSISSKSEIDCTHIVEEECLLLAGWAPDSWGHFLLEYLPRIFILKKFIEENGSLPLYVSEKCPAYVIDAIKNITGELNINIEFFSDNSLTFFKNVVIPPYADSRGLKGIHPQVEFLLKSWIEKNQSHSIPSPKKIYVSRKHLDPSLIISTTPKRKIINENEVESALQSLGFQIVTMESYSFSEKIDLLRNTELIVGGWGSNILNSVLSPSTQTTLALGSGNNMSQVHVCETMHQNYYATPIYNPEDPFVAMEFTQGKPQLVSIENLLKSLELISDCQ